MEGFVCRYILDIAASNKYRSIPVDRRRRRRRCPIAPAAAPVAPAAGEEEDTDFTWNEKNLEFFLPTTGPHSIH